jgi:hypothetical protein
MFHSPLKDITFEQVENFCRTFPEGVRVEYKRELIKDIPKVISSFANSSGGIWVIGVKTDESTNLPRFPLEGMERRAGVEERIIQSAHSGVNPAITPDVRVLDVPGKPDHMLVVVKVPESVEAPHAIENSTKVYVRNASTTEPYELADIDRIAYVIKRREQPERKREELIAQMVSRSWCSGMRTRVVVAPTYPRGTLVPHDLLLQRAQLLQTESALRYLRDCRLIHEGMSSVGASPGQRQYYFEANIYGIVFFEEPGKTSGDAEDYFVRSKTPFVSLTGLLVPIASTLNVAIPLLEGQVTNVLVRYELIEWNGVGYLPGKYSDLSNPGAEAKGHMLSDVRISVSVPTVLETLSEDRVPVMTEVMRQVLWAFNVSDPGLGARVVEALKTKRLA